jgi:hypothetical protein
MMRRPIVLILALASAAWAAVISLDPPRQLAGDEPIEVCTSR